MSIEMQHQHRYPAGAGTDRRSVRERLERYSFAFLIGAALGLLGIAEIADRLDDPSGTGAVILTALASVALLVMLAGAAGAAITCAESSDRRVFHASGITACGLMLAAVGVLLALAAARQGLFTHLASNIAIAASDVADAVLVLAVMTCLTASGIALLDASGARHRERRWSEHLPRH